MPSSRTRKAPEPVEAPDPLADLRDTEPDLATGTGTTPPTQQDGLEFLVMADDLEDAINLALIQATPENIDPLRAELLTYIQKHGHADLPAVGADGGPVALVAQSAQEEMRNQMIVAWHDDTVSLGFLHKGGTCGCRYLAQRVLNVVAPADPEDDAAPEA